jgi:hypothetical protein
VQVQIESVDSASKLVQGMVVTALFASVEKSAAPSFGFQKRADLAR